jgi:hypothetical protein
MQQLRGRYTKKLNSFCLWSNNSSIVVPCICLVLQIYSQYVKIMVIQFDHYKKTMHYWGLKGLKSVNNAAIIEGQNPSKKALSVMVIDNPEPSIMRVSNFIHYWGPAALNIFLTPVALKMDFEVKLLMACSPQ